MNKKYFMPSIFTLFLMLLLIRNSQLTASLVTAGLERCFINIIPSLFPVMVLSELLCGFGMLDFIGKLLGEKLKNWFKVSEKACGAIFAGLIFGFPIGTRALCRLYDRNEISSDELERTIGFCGVPSPAFTANVVGALAFSSHDFGIFLYVISIFTALISGRIFAKAPYGEYKFSPDIPKKEKSAAEIITTAVSSATGAVITLCAYVVFFSCIAGCVSIISDSTLIKTIISGFLELSAGAATSADLGGIIGVTLCGFTVGWSGISIHCQTMALVSERVKSYKNYFFQKLFQGVICAICAAIYASVTDFAPKPTATDISCAAFSLEYTATSFVLFFLCLFGCKKHFLRQKSPNAKR